MSMQVPLQKEFHLPSGKYMQMQLQHCTLCIHSLNCEKIHISVFLSKIAVISSWRRLFDLKVFCSLIFMLKQCKSELQILKSPRKYKALGPIIKYHVSISVSTYICKNQTMLTANKHRCILKDWFY